MIKELTREMVKELQKELQAKQMELVEIGRSRGRCRRVSSDEGADNSEILNINSIEELLRGEIVQIKKTLDNCTIVELEKNANVVSIGALVTVEVLEPNEDEPFQMEVTLSESSKYSVGEKDILSFTINSPIGQCIIGKPIGYIGEYVVKATKRFGNEDQKFICKILDIKYPELV